MKKHGGLCVASCVLAVISELLVVANSGLMGNVLDIAVEGNVRGLLLRGLLMMGILIANNGIFTLSVYLNLQYANLRTLDLREAIAGNLFRRPLWWSREKEDGYYANLLYGDTDKLNLSVYQNYSVEWKFLALFLASLLMIAGISGYLFLISGVFAVLPMAATYFLQRTVSRQGSSCSQKDEAYQYRLNQLVQGWESVKMSPKPMGFLSRFLRPAMAEKGKAYVKKESVQTIAYSLVDFISSLGQLLLIVAGGYLILKQKISTGELVTSVMLSSYVYSGMNNFLEAFLERKSFAEVQKKAEGEAKMAESPREEPSDSPKSQGGGVLQYENVTFGYDERKILSGFSFTFAPGGCYGIVGESGAGKTTLARLALKYRKDFEGRILLDGRDVRDWEDGELYRRIGYLSQGEYLFQDTLENNICLYAEGGVPGELLSRCRLTEVADRLQGESIGDMGNQLSGGERQRVALARVLIRQPELIILDEPTAGLDARIAREIMETVFSMEGITRIIISHDKEIMADKRFWNVLSLKKHRDRTGKVQN